MHKTRCAQESALEEPGKVLSRISHRCNVWASALASGQLDRRCSRRADWRGFSRQRCPGAGATRRSAVAAARCPLPPCNVALTS